MIFSLKQHETTGFSSQASMPNVAECGGPVHFF